MKSLLYFLGLVYGATASVEITLYEFSISYGRDKLDCWFAIKRSSN